MKVNYREPLYLSRYFEVMRDRLPSQFLISQSVDVDFSKESPLDELIELHDETMNVFRETRDTLSSLKELPRRAASSLLDLKSALAGRIFFRSHFFFLF